MTKNMTINKLCISSIIKIPFPVRAGKGLCLVHVYFYCATVYDNKHVMNEEGIDTIKRTMIK